MPRWNRQLTLPLIIRAEAVPPVQAQTTEGAAHQKEA
jgi:hypothetical protein